MLFSRDPGGANCVIPLVEPLKNKGYRVRLFGKDTALQKYAERTVRDYFDITEYLQDFAQSTFLAFLQKERPDFIITGTSADDLTEKYIWKAAERLGIPSFAILDQWLNYGIRFSPYGVSELTEYDIDKKHPYLPTRIMVMDEYARDEMINEGIPRSKILVGGQPHFEFLIQQKDSDGGRRLRSNLGIAESDMVITYASEPISRTYKETDQSEHYWGYTERTIFSDILKALKNISPETEKKLWMIVRPHPKEDPASFADINNPRNGNITIVVDRESTPWDLINASQLICGMSSMFLIEAVLFQKPVLSVQIGLKRQDPFILSRRDIVKSIIDGDTLYRELKSIIIRNNVPIYNFAIIKEPIENIIRHMESFLCQN